MRFRLLYNYAITSAVAFLITAVGILYLFDRSQKKQIITSVEQQNVFLTRVVANDLRSLFLSPEGGNDVFHAVGHYQTGSAFHHMLDSHLQVVLRDVPILKVMVFRDRRTLYSTDPADIGKPKESESLLRAMAQGRAVSGLSFRERFETGDTVFESRSIVETYVPVPTLTGPDGEQKTVVFEIYTDVTPLIADLRFTQLTLLALLAAAFGLLYFVLLLVVRRADRTISRQHEKLVMEIGTRRAAQAELQRANDQKDRFFSVIAHDLRSPYNALLGFSQMLSDQALTLPREKLAEYGGFVRQAGEEAYKLLADLLDWSRLNMDRMEFNPTAFNVAMLLDQNIQRFGPMVSLKDIQLAYDSEADHRVYADLHMADTILRNLISNAVKFTESGGRIEIGHRLVDGHVEIAVKDNGVGIAQDRADKLLVLGERVATTGTKGETGTGLGLVLCVEFARKNGGDLTFSTVEGQGSSFYLTLPPAD